MHLLEAAINGPSAAARRSPPDNEHLIELLDEDAARRIEIVTLDRHFLGLPDTPGVAENHRRGLTVPEHADALGFGLAS